MNRKHRQAQKRDARIVNSKKVTNTSGSGQGTYFGNSKNHVYNPTMHRKG